MGKFYLSFILFPHKSLCTFKDFIRNFFYFYESEWDYKLMIFNILFVFHKLS
jgi:hypothetical protein